MKSSFTGIIQRQHHGKVTPGILQLPWSHPKINTIELPWLDNKKDVSCIPPGIYTLVPFLSPSRGQVWKFLDVPNRSNILLHIANYACDVVINNAPKKKELLGCVAPGFGFDTDIPMVLNSTNAMGYLHTVIGIKTTWQLDIRAPQ